jgi:polar amino acid transport system permease protein
MGELFQGFGNTLLLFAVTLVLSLPLGLLIAFGSMSKLKPVKYISKTFVWIIRGSPLMLQILLVSFIPTLIFGIGNKQVASFFGLSIGNLLFVFVAIAFIINYACYFSEIFRGGIESVNKGQYEAGKVLGMTKNQIFNKVILMQVVKKVLAPTSNEVITLVKDTALARVIMIVEIIQAAQNFAGYGLMWPLFYTAVFYLAFVGLLTLLFGYFEKKLSYYKVMV